MRKELFQPTVESEARLLLLIDAFTAPRKSLEGRTKLAKLDFFLRYPKFMARAMKIKNASLRFEISEEEETNIESRMIRYRYGPWDPTYYAILGRLIGKGLIETVPNRNGISYRSTEKGHRVAMSISSDESWVETSNRIKLLRKYFNLSGSTLKEFIYEHFPEVAGASWGDQL